MLTTVDKRVRSPRETARACARAQTRAFQDLSRLYPDEYRRLYIAHALLEGVKPRGVNPREGQRLAS